MDVYFLHILVDELYLFFILIKEKRNSYLNSQRKNIKKAWLGYSNFILRHNFQLPSFFYYFIFNE